MTYETRSMTLYEVPMYCSSCHYRKRRKACFSGTRTWTTFGLPPTPYRRDGGLRRPGKAEGLCLSSFAQPANTMFWLCSFMNSMCTLVKFIYSFSFQNASIYIGCCMRCQLFYFLYISTTYRSVLADNSHPSALFGRFTKSRCWLFPHLL